MKTKYGIPIANPNNIFKILKSLGIEKWLEVGEAVQVNDQLKQNLTDEEKKHFIDVEIANFQAPRGEIYKGFRWAKKSYGVVVFSMLPGNLIPICGEFRHGCGEVILNLPGGMVDPGESTEVTAKREYEEEVGFALEKLIPLSSQGIPVFARQIPSRNFSFLGKLKKPIISIGQNLDDEEYLKIVLVSLKDWLTLIDREYVDGYSVATTFKALRRLGYIRV